MTKIDMSGFEADTITKVGTSPAKTRAEKLRDWKKENQRAYNNACHEANCTCTPTRAQMLLIDQFEGREPIDL